MTVTLNKDSIEAREKSVKEYTTTLKGHLVRAFGPQKADQVYKTLVPQDNQPPLRRAGKGSR